MIGDDIASAQRQNVFEAAVSKAMALITDAEAQMLAEGFAGRSAAEIFSILRLIAAPEAERTGIAIPYCVSGDPRETSARMHEVATLVVGMMLGPVDPANTVAVRSAGENLLRGSFPGRGFGSRSMYDPSTPGVTPVLLRTVGDTVPQPLIWRACGVTPQYLGTGYSGMAPIKGNLPDRSGGKAGPAVPTASSATMDAMASAAAALEAGRSP